MKKIAFLFAMAFSVAASAGALYWQVDTAASDAFYKNTDFGYATLYAVNNTGTANPTIIESVQVSNGKLDPILSDLGNYGSSGYSFYVELENYTQGSNGNDGTWSTVYKQYATTYDSLVSGGYISNGGLNPVAGTVLRTFNAAAVPEPTSGLLLLVGGGLLALRRRRKA